MDWDCYGDSCSCAKDIYRSRDLFKHHTLDRKCPFSPFWMSLMSRWMLDIRMPTAWERLLLSSFTTWELITGLLLYYRNIPTVHLVMDSKSEIIILLCSFLGNPQPISRIKFCLAEVLVPVPASLSFHIRLLLVTSIHLLTNKNFPIGVWRHELKQRITVVMLNNDIAQLRQWLIEWNQNNPKTHLFWKPH